MNTRFRNTELLGKLERNPLRAQMARALDVAEHFAGDMQALGLNKDLSDQGRQKQMQKHLRNAIRDLRDCRGRRSKNLDLWRKGWHTLAPGAALQDSIRPMSQLGQSRQFGCLWPCALAWSSPILLVSMTTPCPKS